MTAIDLTLRATKTTCPYCGVGCGVLATLTAPAARRSPAIPIIPPISAGCAQRGLRSARPSGSKAGCSIP